MKRNFLATLFLLLMTLAACAPSGGSGELEVSDVWGRTSPMAAANGAFYMNVVNNTGEDDALLSASSDACGVVELHEMYMKENDVMGMRPVPGGQIELPNGETVELKPGGLHVMCLDKQAEFNAGDQYDLTLTFANADDMTVKIEIRDTADGNMEMEHDDMDMEGGEMEHDNMDMEEGEMEHDDMDGDMEMEEGGDS